MCVHAARKKDRIGGGGGVLLEAERDFSLADREHVISSSRRSDGCWRFGKSIGKKGSGGTRRQSCAVPLKSVHIFPSITHQESHQEFLPCCGRKITPADNGDGVKSEKGEDDAFIYTVHLRYLIFLHKEKKKRKMQISLLCVRLQGKRQTVWDCLISMYFLFWSFILKLQIFLTIGIFQTSQKSCNGFKLDKQADNEVQK